MNIKLVFATSGSTQAHPTGIHLPYVVVSNRKVNRRRESKRRTFERVGVLVQVHGDGRHPGDPEVPHRHHMAQPLQPLLAHRREILLYIEMYVSYSITSHTGNVLLARIGILRSKGVSDTHQHESKSFVTLTSMTPPHPSKSFVALTSMNPPHPASTWSGRSCSSASSPKALIGST